MLAAFSCRNVSIGLIINQQASSSGRLQRDDGNLRGAIQPEWDPHRANASIDIKLHRAYLKMPRKIVFSQRRKIHRGHKGKTYLSTMSVAGKHELVPMLCGFRGHIRLMGQKDDRLAIRLRRLGKGLDEVRLWLSLKCVCRTGQPEALSFA